MDQKLLFDLWDLADRPCRHCGLKRACRPKQLCARCSRRPEVRERYASLSKYARQGAGVEGSYRIPPAPTCAPPGSEAKLAVLEQRAALGVCLFHPSDARGFGRDTGRRRELSLVS
jgi:hypothetical protein